MSETTRRPRVRVRNRGRVTEAMRAISSAYRKASGRECRWVYDPIHRPELSGVLPRMADGYLKVHGRDLEDTELLKTLGLKEDDPVRFADSVLMSISTEERNEIKKELQEAADDQIRSIDRKYYEAIDGIGVGDGGKALDEQHKPRPRGRSVIEEREFAFEYTQKTGGE